MEISGATCGAADCDAVFFTHYHGDHIGLYADLLPDIPLYMGEAAKKIYTVLQKRLSHRLPEIKDRLSTLGSIKPFSASRPVRIGNIEITPLMVDHSAYDAYMFLIEAEGKKILHTGDYRLHGFRGKGVLPTLKKYVGQVDVLITEGTRIANAAGEIETERDVEMKAAAFMRQHKYVFALCSSTNIDRLAGFAAAARKEKRLFICDRYQKDVLNIVSEYGGKRSPLYDFSKALVYGSNLLSQMQERGFCLMVRVSPFFADIIRKFPAEESLILYSMWRGYIERDEKIREFLAGGKWEYLHTSGHGTTAQISEVIGTVAPRFGVIPIHTEEPERFAEICSPYKVISLNDKEKFLL